MKEIKSSNHKLREPLPKIDFIADRFDRGYVSKNQSSDSNVYMKLGRVNKNGPDRSKTRGFNAEAESRRVLGEEC